MKSQCLALKMGVWKWIEVSSLKRQSIWKAIIEKIHKYEDSRIFVTIKALLLIYFYHYGQDNQELLHIG
jgi:hypothetical protein